MITLTKNGMGVNSEPKRLFLKLVQPKLESLSHTAYLMLTDEDGNEIETAHLLALSIDENNKLLVQTCTNIQGEEFNDMLELDGRNRLLVGSV